MKKRVKSKNPLKKIGGRGFRGFPVATVAFYGPDNLRASKVAVGIVLSDDADPVALERWFSEKSDVRSDPGIGAEILELIRLYKTKSVILTDRIVGCPHEEGKDYPEGETCPHCPFWAGRDRFTHDPIN
jgi:hypothetical protein